MSLQELDGKIATLETLLVLSDDRIAACTLLMTLSTALRSLSSPPRDLVLRCADCATKIRQLH